MDNTIFNTVDNENRTDVLNNNSRPVVPRSVFPYGCSSIMSMNEGYIYPVDCFMTLPHDSVDIDFAAYLESLNPFVDRQYSGMKLCFHVFYNKCEHEWKGWKTFATKGIRGNINQVLPLLTPGSTPSYYSMAGEILLQSDDSLYGCIHDTDHSLCCYLTGLASAGSYNQDADSYIKSSQLTKATQFGLAKNTQVNRSFSLFREQTNPLTGGSYLQFNAIPFAEYQRIFRKFYLNQNLVKDNKHWFPDDDDDFCLPYAGGFVSVLSSSAANPNKPVFSVVPNNCTDFSEPGTGHLTNIADMPYLAQMRCRQFFGDAFTTSVPFLERNGVTKLWLTSYSGLLNTSTSIPNGSLLSNVPDKSVSPLSLGDMKYASGTGSTEPFTTHLSNSSGSVLDMFGTFLTLNNIQELSAATLWSLRNAKSKGDYNSLIEAHYGWNPDSEDREPIYLGGSVQRLNFDNVVSLTETTNQPLGTKTSIASSGGRSSIPHFECPDYGYIMILASLVPDTFYTQGLREEFDPYMLGSDLPWPEFANLQKENVLKKRLFFTGAPNFDNVLIGYNERFLNWKYRPNRLLGRFVNSYDSKFRSMTFARYFDYNDMLSFNSINNEFVTCSPYSLRNDMYTVPNQPHFVLQFGDNVRVVRSLPYAAKEAVLTNIA